MRTFEAPFITPAAVSNQLEIPLNGVDSCAPILALHRAPDSYISYSRRKPDGEWENLFSLRADELREMFPAIASWLVQDAYFTINGMYRPGFGVHESTGQRNSLRGEKHLRYLNACYVDLDCGRENSEDPQQRLTWRDVAANLGNLMDAGVLPQSSIFARSGRGVYVFWALRDDDDPDMPPRHNPVRLALYKKINQAICRRLEHLAADMAAVDAARVLRVPGTFHSGASTEVAERREDKALYQVQHNGDGRIFTYTLSELAEFFGVEEVRPSLPDSALAMNYGTDWVEMDEAGRDPGNGERVTRRPGTAPNRRRGRDVLHAARARDLAVWEQARGGWVKGRRKWHLMRYAEFLRGAGTREAVVARAVRTMAANCRPPYPSDAKDTPIAALVGEVFSSPLPKYTNEALCKCLGVTPELAREYGLKTIIPSEVRQERKSPAGGHRGLLRQGRKEWLRDRIAGLRGVRVSSRQLARESTAAGFPANHATINKELKTLGVEVVRKAAGRPARADSVVQPLFSLAEVSSPESG